MQYRKLINTIHLWLGLTCGTILLIVAVTGCIMAFEDEIRDATQDSLLYVQPQSKPQVEVQAVVSVIKTVDPKIKLSQLRYFGDPKKSHSMLHNG